MNRNYREAESYSMMKTPTEPADSQGWEFSYGCKINFFVILVSDAVAVT